MISGDLVALFGASWCRLGLMDCTRTPLVSGFQCCFVLYFSCVQKPRTPEISGDLVALFDASEGTVSAYPFNMLKKPQASATAEKQGPAAVGGALGETLSKQVYLGMV